MSASPAKPCILNLQKDELMRRMKELGLALPRVPRGVTRDQLLASALEQLKERGFYTEQLQRRRGKKNGDSTYW